ncbi:MAG: CCA tRNA nucleotidyltransferase [Dehalococcoidia bacterium]|nr:CCA tRNA nucleotidyltransferase [Dehalococcoidia bacterium]
MMSNSIALELGQKLEPDLLETCRTLGGIAEQGTLFIVGGAVRDILLGRNPVEVDLVVQGDAEDLAQRAVQFRLARRTTASQFMTVKLTIGTRDMDIATARSETYASPGALPDVAPADIKTDLGRRDFAANAIAVSIGSMDFGRVIDPHRGVNDVQAGVLRALHAGSFRDDATRMIRAARYASRLRFRLNSETEAWLKNDASSIGTVGPDRLRNEFNRLWREKAPIEGLINLQSWGVLDHLPTASNWVSGLYSFSMSDREAAARPDDADDADVHWALIATTVGAEYDTLIDTFHLAGSSRRAVDDIRLWKESGLTAFREASEVGRPSNFTELLSHYEPAALEALYLTGDAAAARAIASYLGTWRHVQPELNGNDLLEMGVLQGPLVGKFLDQLRKARLDNLVLSRDDEAQLVRQWTGHGSVVSDES